MELEDALGRERSWVGPLVLEVVLSSGGMDRRGRYHIAGVNFYFESRRSPIGSSKLATLKAQAKVADTLFARMLEIEMSAGKFGSSSVNRQGINIEKPKCLGDLLRFGRVNIEDDEP